MRAALILLFLCLFSFVPAGAANSVTIGSTVYISVPNDVIHQVVLHPGDELQVNRTCTEVSDSFVYRTLSCEVVKLQATETDVRAFEQSEMVTSQHLKGEVIALLFTIALVTFLLLNPSKSSDARYGLGLLILIILLVGMVSSIQNISIQTFALFGCTFILAYGIFATVVKRQGRGDTVLSSRLTKPLCIVCIACSAATIALPYIN